MDMIFSAHKNGIKSARRSAFQPLLSALSGQPAEYPPCEGIEAMAEQTLIEIPAYNFKYLPRQCREECPDDSSTQRFSAAVIVSAYCLWG